VALPELDACAVVTMELQRGVVGDLSPLPELAAEVQARGVVGATARLARAARDRGRPVVHCTAEFRPDRAGSAQNAPLLARLARLDSHLLKGSPGAELVEPLGPEPSDLVCARLHGVSPFGGTELDAWLRNLGVGVVVAAGVSLNVGVVGLAVEAVNLGYRVVVATDAVAGYPPAYAEAVLEHTLSHLAWLAEVDAIVEAMDRGAGR
jgi:nicotinamidase-related amidase